jgi:hypothetical protein
MNSWTAEDAKQLDELSTLLHDAWLPFGSLNFDPEAREVSATVEDVACLGGFETRALGLFASCVRELWNVTLVVSHVTSVSTVDDAEIGGLDVRDVLYRNSENLLVIEGGVPARIEIAVEAFSVRVEYPKRPSSQTKLHVLWPFYRR